MMASRPTSGEEPKSRSGSIDSTVPAFPPAGFDLSGGWADGGVQLPGLVLPQFGVVQTVTSWM